MQEAAAQSRRASLLGDIEEANETAPPPEATIAAQAGPAGGSLAHRNVIAVKRCFQLTHLLPH